MFEVDKELSEKMKKKYENITLDIYEDNLGPCKIQIQSRIAKEFLEMSEEETKYFFKKLCILFLETCHDYKIQCNPLHILIMTDDEITRSLQCVFQMEDDGSFWGYIFIPPIILKLKEHPCLIFTFLHELGHCWIKVQHKDLKPYEIFTDLTAICSLRKVVPSHKKTYRDVIKLFTYIGGEAGQKYLGTALQREALQNPESYLKQVLKMMEKEVNS